MLLTRKQEVRSPGGFVFLAEILNEAPVPPVTPVSAWDVGGPVSSQYASNRLAARSISSSDGRK